MKRNSVAYAAKRHSFGIFLNEKVGNDANKELLTSTVKQILENENNGLASILLDAERFLFGDYVCRKEFNNIEFLLNVFLQTDVENINKLELGIFADVIKDKIDILSVNKESKVKALGILQDYFSDLSADNQQYHEVYSLLGGVEETN